MSEYEFTLKYALPGPETDPQHFLQRLASAGCEDALVGIGKKGRIALDFTRADRSSKRAILSAMRDVQRAIPGARLIEASPDVVGLTDVAELIGCSRQNVRKLCMGDPLFPVAIHEGQAELFHLVEVLDWAARKRRPVDPRLLEVATTTRELNLAKQLRRLPAGKIAADMLAAV